MLDGDELVAELAHLVLGPVEDACRGGRGAHLQVRRALGARAAREVGLGLLRERGRAGACALGERLRQLLLEQREQQVLGVDLGVGVPPRQLLAGGDRLLALIVSLLKSMSVLLGTGCVGGR